MIEPMFDFLARRQIGLVLVRSLRYAVRVWDSGETRAKRCALHAPEPPGSKLA